MKNSKEKSITIRIFDKNESDECNKIISESQCISLSQIPAPSLKKYWLTSFIDFYSSTRDLAVSIVYKDRVPRLILPMQKTNNESLEFLCDETSDYNDFLYEGTDFDILQYSFEFWASQGIRKIKLDRIPVDSLTVPLLKQLSHIGDWNITTDNCDTIPIISVNPALEIQNWEGVKPDCIKRYKRKAKALSKIANISYSFIENESQLIDEFPAIRKLHIQRWKSIGIYSKYLDINRESFIINVCKNALREESLFFPLMMIDGNLASYIIGFRGGNTIFDWNTSFSIAYKRWSPGALLLLHILSNFEKYNFNTYNLMKGGEKHKFIWTNKCENNLSLVMTIK